MLRGEGKETKRNAAEENAALSQPAEQTVDFQVALVGWHLDPHAIGRQQLERTGDLQKEAEKEVSVSARAQRLVLQHFKR